MTERIENVLDKAGIGGAFLLDLSKAFDCIQHDPLIAKLHVYGFNIKSLKLFNNYLYNRTQRTKIKSTCSERVNIIFGVPQGFILGPLLFNIYINDIFLFKVQTDITNYADDNTPFVCCSNGTAVISKRKHDAKIFIQWFKDNGLKQNEDKCKLITFSKQENNSTLSLGNEVVTSSRIEKLLDITIDHKLTFNKHVENLCIKANKKS